MNPNRRFGKHARRLASPCAISLIGCVFGTNPDYEDSGGVASESGQASGTETGEAMPGSLELSASFAGCRSTGDYGPAQCSASANTPDALVIDRQGDDDPDELVACLTFVLDDTFAGQVVTQAVLEIHTTPGMGSASNTSGEVWAVEPFTVEGFELEVPAKLGAEPLALDPGPAQVNKPIRWELSTEVIIPNTPLHVCVYPVSDDDVHFFSHEGTRPPSLSIEYE